MNLIVIFMFLHSSSLDSSTKSTSLKSDFKAHLIIVTIAFELLLTFFLNTLTFFFFSSFKNLKMDMSKWLTQRA